MKRKGILIICLVLITALTGCGRSVPETPSVKPPTASTEMPTPTPTPTQAVTPTPAILQKLNVNWEKEEIKICPSAQEIIVDPQDNNTLYAVGVDGQFQGVFPPHQVWKTTDGGETWSYLGNTGLNVGPDLVWRYTSGPGAVIPQSRNRFPALIPGFVEFDSWRNQFSLEIIPILTLGPGLKEKVSPDIWSWNGWGYLDTLTIDGNVVFAAVDIFRLDSATLASLREIAPEIKTNQLGSGTRLVFSLDGGNSWYELTTPLVLDTTLDSGLVCRLVSQRSIAVVPSNNQVRFYIGLNDGTIWQTTVQKASLP